MQLNSIESYTVTGVTLSDDYFSAVAARRRRGPESARLRGVLRRYAVEYQLLLEGPWWFAGCINARTPAGAIRQYSKEHRATTPAFTALRATLATADILRKITGQGRETTTSLNPAE